MVTESDVYALEQRIRQLEEKIEYMAGVGDMIEVRKPYLYGDVYVYKTEKFMIKNIMKRVKK